MAKSKNSKGTNGRGDQYKLKAIRAEEAFDPKASRIRFGDDDVYGGDEDECMSPVYYTAVVCALTNDGRSSQESRQRFVRG